jgi:hypothetical protein
MTEAAPTEYEVALAKLPGSDFDYDLVDAHLDGESEVEPASSAEAVGAVRNLLAWLSTPKARRYFGRQFHHRLIALAWVSCPDSFTLSLSKLAQSNGISKQALSRHAAEASRIFGIRNGAQQAHGTRFKKQRQRPR